MPRAIAMSKTDLFKNSLERTKGRITRRQLVVELNKVRKAGVEMILSDYDKQPVCLLGSFIWADTPQGMKFWGDLYNGY